MKLLIILSVFLFYLTESCISTNNKTATTNNDDCQVILDSANIFAQKSEWAVNMKPSSDTERSLNVSKWLEKQSFKKLSCLLESQNLSLKVVGAVFAEITNADSLIKTYPYLLSDTTSMQLMTSDGNGDSKEKLGEFLLGSIISNITENKDTLAIEPGIEYIISAFIKKYSNYPNSYKSISFSHFLINIANNDISRLIISHTYEIKDNEGKTTTVTSGFTLDHDNFNQQFDINVIEKDTSSYIYSSPPILSYWLKEFGRSLNKNDTLILGLR